MRKLCGAEPLPPCRPDGVGHHRAALAQRLLGAHRQILRGLMLDLGVKLAAEQDHDGRDPHPHHHADSGAEGRRASWTAQSDDPTYLAQLEPIFEGLRTAEVPEQ